MVTTDNIDSGGGKMSSFDWRVILTKHMEDSQTIGRITRTSTTIDRTLGSPKYLKRSLYSL